ncbi:MAG: potassium channel family protein [Clostridium sp.]
MKVDKKTIIYESIMSLLALILLFSIMIEMSMDLSEDAIRNIRYIDNSVWLIYVIDYFYRLYKAKDKKQFVKYNKIDLVTIIPYKIFEYILSFLGVGNAHVIAKLVKVLRVIVLIGKFGDEIKRVLKQNNFQYIIYITGSTVIIGACLIAIAEDMTFGDALWWSFVTSTTVGYGDISPSSFGGRMIAVVLMVVGIGFISMLTGNIATFFMERKKQKTSYKDNIIDDIKEKLDDLDDLTEEDIDNIYKVLKALKSPYIRKTDNYLNERVERNSISDEI